jgi:hypothetical protein
MLVFHYVGVDEVDQTIMKNEMQAVDGCVVALYRRFSTI